MKFLVSPQMEIPFLPLNDPQLEPMVLLVHSDRGARDGAGKTRLTSLGLETENLCVISCSATSCGLERSGRYRGESPRALRGAQAVLPPAAGSAESQLLSAESCGGIALG